MRRRGEVLRRRRVVLWGGLLVGRVLLLLRGGVQLGMLQFLLLCGRRSSPGGVPPAGDICCLATAGAIPWARAAPRAADLVG